jgi:hypothetical protein
MKKWKIILLVIAIVYLILLIPILSFLCHYYFMDCKSIGEKLSFCIEKCHKDPQFVFINYIILAIPSWVLFLIVIFWKKKKKSR